MGHNEPVSDEPPKPTLASDRLLREAEQDGPTGGDYVLDDGRVISGRELVRPLAERIRRRRRRKA
jgi:hypothetical protein